MKKLILALVVGMLIGSTSVAFAANNDSVQAFFEKFNFKIDGKEKKLKATPLVVDGTSYLPVRELSELLGYEVKYDDPTKTIVLNQKPKDVNNVPTTPTETHEKLSDVNKDEWVKRQDIREQFGVIYIPQADGEDYLKKGDLEFKFSSTGLEDYTEQSITYKEITIRIKVVLGYIHFNIEDLKKAGFISGNQ